MSGVDTRQLKAWIKRLKNLDKWRDCRDECVSEIANTVLTMARKNTPVITGNLRRGFEMTDISSSENYSECKVVNNVSYAAYVEYGHRNSGHTGYQKGRFMLTKAEKNAKGHALDIVSDKVEDYINEVMGND